MTRSATGDWVRAMQRTATITPESTRTVAMLVDENATRAGARPALVGETAALTHAELAALTHRIARWAQGEGLRQGDVVALMMKNGPAYVAIWIGLSRLGIVTALLNTQLVGDGLAHCLAAAAPRGVIFGDALRPAIEAIGPPIPVWTWSALEARLATLPSDPLRDAPVVALRDPALLIHTSGTTGLPKAARVSHYRIMMWSEWFAGIMDAREDDRLYDCLPLYHSVGGIVAVGAMLAAGGTTILRQGFSARRFWADVRESGATIFQYIGELCRYLAAAPPGDDERSHHLRLCIGNGLQGDVWTRFATRFAIPRIIEFYAATEGSFSLFNLEGQPGAIGRIPRFMAHRSPIALVRHDHATGAPLRGADGFCERCDSDEPGEAIGEIATRAGDLATRFEGYTNEAESDRKILRDVFAPGDRWFRTGDLMARDKAGFFRFVDRIGDTFRWKGENVATTEVAAILRAAPGVTGAEVYGVVVPHNDGRAGMAALTVADPFDLAALHAHVAASLPRYARPVFVRCLDALDLTGTFKVKKAVLADEGFDPARIDRLYIDDQGGYRAMTPDDHAAIVSAARRL